MIPIRKALSSHWSLWTPIFTNAHFHKLLVKYAMFAFTDDQVKEYREVLKEMLQSYLVAKRNTGQRRKYGRRINTIERVLSYTQSMRNGPGYFKGCLSSMHDTAFSVRVEKEPEPTYPMPFVLKPHIPKPLVREKLIIDGKEYFSYKRDE